MEIVCSRYCTLMSKRGEEWRSAYCHFQITFWQCDMQSLARFLSAIIPAHTVSYCDSSSKWTISKTLYCYFNPLRLIFPFAWHFFHSVSSHCAKALFRLRRHSCFSLGRQIPSTGIWKWEVAVTFMLCMHIFQNQRYTVTATLYQMMWDRSYIR